MYIFNILTKLTLAPGLRDFFNGFDDFLLRTLYDNNRLAPIRRELALILSNARDISSTNWVQFSDDKEAIIGAIGGLMTLHAQLIKPIALLTLECSAQNHAFEELIGIIRMWVAHFQQSPDHLAAQVLHFKIQLPLLLKTIEFLQQLMSKPVWSTRDTNILCKKLAKNQMGLLHHSVFMNTVLCNLPK